MNFLRNVLRKGDKTAAPNMRQQLILTYAQGEGLRGDSEADIAWRQNLAFKYEAIHDEEREAILAHKTLIPQLVPLVGPNGIEYQKDENGKILRDGNKNPIPQYVEAYTVDNVMASIVNIQSHVNRLSFLDPASKRLVQLYMEDVIETAKLMMPERDCDLGLEAYLDSWIVNTLFMVDDAIKGNKVKSMLEITKRTTLEVGETPKQKKGVF